MSNAVKIPNFIENWNAKFFEYPLSMEDLKKSHSLMSALFLIYERLGIDRDAVLMPPTESNINDHVMYYQDLVPVINMTRVINHLLSVTCTPEMAQISINHFLQPTIPSSYTILLLLFNLMVFNEEHLQRIAPYEENLFNFSDAIKALEVKRTEMLDMLNRQAEEKAKRSNRMEQMNEEILKLEKELEQEEAVLNEDKHELDLIVKENNAMDVLLEQKRATKEGLLAERERKRAHRVYDANDIRTQAAQAAQNMKDAEEKLDSLKVVLAQKETSLQILQTIKPNLDTANNMLHEIAKLKDFELGDIEEESKDGELELLQTDLMELQAQAGEVTARRTHTHTQRQHAHTRRQQERAAAESALREAEDKDKKRREFTASAAQRVEEIKQLTVRYEEEKTTGFTTIKQIADEYDSAVKEWADALNKLVENTKAKAKGQN